MISMVEKIKRLAIENCEHQLCDMLSQLRSCRDEFLSSPYLQDFEREWVNNII